MTTYLESVLEGSIALLAKQNSNAQIAHATQHEKWNERLTPLEVRLAKLLSTIPEEIASQGLALNDLRRLLSGKWRGNCHPGELGAALRKLGYVRIRNWSALEDGFSAKWFQTK
jgi:hypothetical protein